MLTKYAIDAVEDHAIITGNRGDTYTAKNQGVLYAPVKASPCPSCCDWNYPDSATIIKTMLFEDSKEPTLGHNEAMVAGVSLLTGSLTSSLGFMKSSILPIIKDLSSQVQEVMHKVNNANPISDFSVVQLSIPGSVLEQPYGLSRYEHITPTNAVAKNGLNIPYDKETTIALSATGNDAITNDTMMLFTVVDDKLIKTTWDMLFNRAFVPSHVKDHLSTIDVFSKIRLLAVMLLVANNIEDQPQSVTDTMTLAEYQQLMIGIKQFIGSNLNRSLMNANQLVRGKTLVTYSNVRERKICVYAPHYRTFLDEGGTVEALLGRCIVDDQVNRIGEILNKVVTYGKAWSSYVLYTNRDQAQMALRVFSSNITHLFREQCKTMTKAEKEYHHCDVMPASVFHRFHEELECVHAQDLTNIDDVCMRLVTKSRFHFTDAYTTLKYMSDISKSNPEIPTQEAHLIATIEHVAKYLAEQITINKS